MNKELLADISDEIAYQPERFDMEKWSNGTVTTEGEMFCGTTACIAGWAIALTEGSFDEEAWFSGNIGETARVLLDLPDQVSGFVQGSDLFYIQTWPQHYRDLAFNESEAKGAIAIIDALINETVIFNDHGELVDTTEVP